MRELRCIRFFFEEDKNILPNDNKRKESHFWLSRAI